MQFINVTETQKMQYHRNPDDRNWTKALLSKGDLLHSF